MQMAKPYFDLGLQTDQGAAMRQFWHGELGLDAPEVLDVYDGVQQHRYALHGAVLKLNVMANPMAAAPPTGYRKILIADENHKDRDELTDPDGNKVQRLGSDGLGEQDLALVVAVRDLDSFRKFYGERLELTALDDDVFAWGNSQLRLLQDAAAAASVDDHGSGIRYITFQVRELDGLHARLIKAGVTEHMPPKQWNEMSYVSFIRDPDNNLIELSQRADLA